MGKKAQYQPCTVCGHSFPPSANEWGECSPLHWRKAIQHIQVLRADGAKLREIPRSVGVPRWFVESLIWGKDRKVVGEVGEPDEAEAAKWAEVHRQRVYQNHLHNEVNKTRVTFRLGAVEQQSAQIVGSVEKRLRRIKTELQSCAVTDLQRHILVTLVDQLRLTVEELERKEGGVTVGKRSESR